MSNGGIDNWKLEKPYMLLECTECGKRHKFESVEPGPTSGQHLKCDCGCATFAVATVPKEHEA